jgi:Skp family chaperone for outer membrane proteins
MKKVLIAVVALVGLLSLNTNEAKAQAPVKVGFFDLETMLSAMPGYYQKVDSLLEIFERDSLTAEYDFFQAEFKRLDSTYKADSATGKAPTILERIKRDRNDMAIKLIYWQQYAQNSVETKRSILAGPMAQLVFEAYKKVLQKGNYTMVVSPQTLEPYSLNLGLTKVDNLFVPVAKELKIKLPVELGGGDAKPDVETPVKPKPKTN